MGDEQCVHPSAPTPRGMAAVPSEHQTPLRLQPSHGSKMLAVWSPWLDTLQHKHKSKLRSCCHSGGEGLRGLETHEGSWGCGPLPALVSVPLGGSAILVKRVTALPLWAFPIIAKRDCHRDESNRQTTSAAPQSMRLDSSASPVQQKQRSPAPPAASAREAFRSPWGAHPARLGSGVHSWPEMDQGL